MTPIVYMATNEINGEHYIGVTKVGLSARKKAHFYDSAAKRPGCRAFNAAIRKYGFLAFSWTVLSEHETYQEALDTEILAIRDLSPRYNITKGGQGIIVEQRSERWRKNISIGLTGRKLSVDSIERMRISKKKGGALDKPIMCLEDGKIFCTARDASEYYSSSESQIRAACTGEWVTAKGRHFINFEKIMYEPERMAMIAHLDSRIMRQRENISKIKSRPVICITTGDGFKSAREASMEMKLPYGCIVNACQIGSVVSGKYEFRYSDREGKTTKPRPKWKPKPPKTGVIGCGVYNRKKVEFLADGTIFESLTDAARHAGISVQSMSSICHRNGKYTRVCGGYRFWEA